MLQCAEEQQGAIVIDAVVVGHAVAVDVVVDRVGDAVAVEVARLGLAEKNGEPRTPSVARVREDMQQAIRGTHHQVSVAIAIEVDEGGVCVAADRQPAEWRVGGGDRPEGGVGGCAHVHKEVKLAIGIANDEVKVAVAIEVN